MPTPHSLSDSVILITREGIGSAPSDLQKKLLDTYLGLLAEGGSIPAAICFYTEGVKLVIEGSTFLERLTVLERRGVRLISCSTCLGYFGVTDQVRVGIVGGMGDILEAQTRAAMVITL